MLYMTHSTKQKKDKKEIGTGRAKGESNVSYGTVGILAAHWCGKSTTLTAGLSIGEEEEAWHSMSDHIYPFLPLSAILQSILAP